MLRTVVAVALVLLPAAQASHASQSIVLGYLRENEPMQDAPPACPKDYYCPESWWRSLIEVDQVVSGDPVSGGIRAVGRQMTSRMGPESDMPRLFVLSRIDGYDDRQALQADYLLIDAATPASAHRAACKPFEGEVFRADLEQAFDSASFDAYLAKYGDHGPVELVVENEYDEDQEMRVSKYGSLAALAAWFQDAHGHGQSMIIPESRSCRGRQCDYQLPENTLHHGTYLTGYAADETAGCAALVRFAIHWG